jgi:hypothetical protein
VAGPSPASFSRPSRHRPPGSTPAASRIYDLPAAHSDQLCAASGAWSPISGTAQNGSACVLSDLPSIQRVTGDRLILKTERHSRSGATGQPAAPLAAGQGSAVSDTTLSTARARRDRTSASCRRRVHVPGTVARSSQPTPKPAHRARRPSSFSILRRSRLVGRPAPRSRAATGTASSGGGGGGLLSM